MFHYFQVKKSCFGGRFYTKTYTNWATIGAIHLNKIEVWRPDYLSEKGLNNICHGLRGMNFFQEKCCKILALHHLSSKCGFLVTVTPNRTRPEPIKIRHLELSKDIKFEEIGARKGLQTALHHPTFIFKTTHLPRAITLSTFHKNFMRKQ